MDLELVRYAPARQHGHPELELSDGESSFTARLARAAPVFRELSNS